MQIIKTIKGMQAFSRKIRTEGNTIGFVPTMGALHEGHLSLVKRCREENDITVVSIFVNPAQFGPNEDFRDYPRDGTGDLKKLTPLGADAVFMPHSSDMYPRGFSISVHVGKAGELLCGASRPGHFNGVATVVAKLFNTVMPDRAYFGQKDFQQSVIIRKLAQELNCDTDIVVCPIVREPDGLAMSSRNMYLSEEERKSALMLYKSLQYAEELIMKAGEHESASVIKKMETLISSDPAADIDYIQIVDPDTLEKMDRIILPAVVCIAVKIGKTRLIDNIIIDS